MASLLPDPLDSQCPEEFIRQAAEIVSAFGSNIKPDERNELRTALLNFIGEMADWDLGNNPLFISTAKKLIKAAHPYGKPVTRRPDRNAEAIAKHISFVIGMNKAIGDEAAIEFAVAFYDALGAGESFEFAHRFACNAIQLAGIPEQLTPVLKRKAQS